MFTDVFNSVKNINAVNLGRPKMSIQERKGKENDALKMKVLGAATRILAEQGYNRLSMRKIAAIIDYSPTTIYRFFRNKEELLANIAAQVFMDLTAEFEKVKTTGWEDPLSVLKSLIRSYISFCLERPDMFKLFNGVASFEWEEGVMYERLGSVRRPVYESWREAIRRSIGADRIGIKDETRVFLYLWDSTHGYIEHRVSFPLLPRKDPGQDPEDFLDLLFHGIEPESPSR